MDTRSELVKFAERMFVEYLYTSLDKKYISDDDARQLARTFLEQEPFTNIPDLETKIQIVSRSHKNAYTLPQFYKEYIEKQKRQSIVEEMRRYLQAKEVDKALQVAVQSK